MPSSISPRCPTIRSAISTPTSPTSINHRASVRLADARQGGRRVGASCSPRRAATTARPATTWSTRPAALNPVTAYGKSKVLVRARHRASSPATASARPTCARPRPTACRRACASTSCSTTSSPGRSPQGVIYLKSDGSPWRPIVHIEDISRAFIAALEAPRGRVFNEAFNVGQTAHNYRIRDIAEIVAEVVPGCRLEFAPDAGPDKRSYRVSFEKIARVLPDFKPQWDARKGAEQLYAAYRASGLTLEEFEGPRYQRISHIKKLMADGILDARSAAHRRAAADTAPSANAAGGRAVADAHDLGPLARRCRRAWATSIYALAAELYPICRSITGNGVRADARHRCGGTCRSAVTRGADRHQRLRLDDPARMEHPRRLYQERAPASASSTSADSNLHVVELQRAGARRHAARRAEEAHLHAARAARPDPLPHVLLCRDLGLLHGARSACGRCPTATTRSCIDSSLDDGSLTYGEYLHQGRDRRTNSCCRPISAIRRSPTTTAPAWRC